MTPAAVISWHVREAERYILIAQGWTDSASAEARRAAEGGFANGVRADAFEACARQAQALGQQHLDMAHALTPCTPQGRAP